MRQRWTAQEKAEFVAEYLLVDHGKKASWLAERGIGRYAMRDWRRAYLYGDLARGLVPRDTGGMSVSDGARMRQLEVELAAERAARAADHAQHVAEVDRLNRMNEALGKAIGLLHDRAGGPEPTDGTSTTQRRRTTKDSSTSRTVSSPS